MKDKNLLKFFLRRRDIIEFTFFGTVTFGEESRTLVDEQKVEKFRNFIKKLKRKKNFEYFWVKEKEGEELHFHLISTWDYSYNYIQSEWNKFIDISIKCPSVRISTMEEGFDSYKNRVNYLFKDTVQVYGISSKLKTAYVEFVKKLDYVDFTLILKTGDALHGEKVKLIETREGNLQDEQKLEEGIVNIFFEHEMNPNIINWMQKLFLVLKQEKEEFFLKLKKGKEKNLVWYMEQLDESDHINLWKGLLFFYIVNGLRKYKILHHHFYENLKILLFFVKERKMDWYKIDKIELDVVNEIWYNLILIMEFYFKEVMLEYIDIKETEEENKIYRQIIIKKEFATIDWNDKFNNYKGKKPMVVKPKKWSLEKDDGGYLFNKKLFSFPLCKSNFASNLQIKSQRAIESLNYLQDVPYQVNSYLLSYLNYNKVWIKQQLFGDIIDVEVLKEKLYNVKKKISSEFKKKEKDKVLILNLYKERNNLVSKINEIEKFDNILSVANEMCQFDSIYFMIQLDFRGRINVVSDYLNYQGDNLSRSLITLKKESKISLYWFKIYCLKKFGENLIGKNIKQMHEVFDKKLHLIMVNYRENHCWLQAEDKFEFLNCCLQYEKYLIFGEQYRTQFTIYFDATCSGSQLITLLLGVDEYVKDLNLAATSEMDELKDYYLRIVNDYKKLLLDELKNNDTLKNELLEKLKTNWEWRKFFKHIIMTLNYGLTEGGIIKKLFMKDKEMSLHFSVELMKIVYSVLSNYISEISLVKSLNVFTNIVSEVSQLNRDIYLFTTYSGFIDDEENADYIFKQGYRIWNKKTVAFDKKMNLNIENKKLTDKELRKRFRKKYTFINVDYKKVDNAKQTLAFKANIIHHLDAMWVHSCLNQLSKIDGFGGICVIHDCFGVSFDDINILNKIVRKCLVEFFQKDNPYQLLYSLNKSKYDKKYKLTIEEENKIRNLLKEYNMNAIEHRNKILYNLEFSYYLIFPG
jgi:hypothetical protein